MARQRKPLDTCPSYEAVPLVAPQQPADTEVPELKDSLPDGLVEVVLRKSCFLENQSREIGYIALVTIPLSRLMKQKGLI